SRDEVGRKTTMYDEISRSCLGLLCDERCSKLVSQSLAPMADRLLLNGLMLDIERAELCDASGRVIQLRPQALSVLLELARRPGELVTKRDLMTRCWP